MGKKRKFIQEDLNSNNSDIYNFEKGISSKNSNEEHNEYSDHIYVGESESKEQLYDRNNRFYKTLIKVYNQI